ncbi:MAG TPA: hypothetical protein VJL29_14465, partial [Thermoguttaceae bacterium]|nr:hypothetical protein [Thermoguttaceae bacterium]
GRFERFADGRWEFRDLEGTNDTAQVRCDGQLFDGPRGKQLALTLTGRNVPLDKELHDSLKSSMQQAWDNLEPTGTIDLETNVTWLVEPKKLELVVVARPRADAASIKPRMFPYLMEKLQGTLVYRDGRVTFDDFHARHGRTEITGRGQWDFLPDGSWDFCIRDVAVDRLRPDDRDLLQALPGRLRESLARLNIEGTMYLARGRFDVHHSPAVAAPTRTAWDARLGLQPGRISCGLSIDNIRGEVALRGESDGATFSSEGELDVESLSYKKLQFTEVRGPLWIEPDRVLFGSWVAKREQQPNGAPIAPPRAVTGRLLGGTVRADAWVAPKFTPCYALNAELLGADLAQYATETMTGRQELKGRMGMTLNLMGRRPTIAGLQGGGRMWLRDGDVYKLPVMIAMLKLLSMQEPDVTAFSDADILFQIAGDHVYLSQIQFNGDAVSLVGQGELDFQSNIDLAFSARLGRNKWQVPILTPLMGEASRQTMVIKVRGPLYDPEASRDVLPGVKEALRELEANLRSSPAAGPGQPAFGQPNPGPNPLRR